MPRLRGSDARLYAVAGGTSSSNVLVTSGGITLFQDRCTAIRRLAYSRVWSYSIRDITPPSVESLSLGFIVIFIIISLFVFLPASYLFLKSLRRARLYRVYRVVVSDLMGSVS